MTLKSSDRKERGQAMVEFALLLPPAAEHGRLLIAHEGAHRERITAGLGCAVDTFGTSGDADFQVAFDAGSRDLEVLRRGRPLARWTNAMPGDHNALNAAAGLRPPAGAADMVFAIQALTVSHEPMGR